ncbi:MULTISPECIES: phospho-N-acetylmuramoyl-pentapeptide-transferase [Paenibacillus]|uniref:phospho-N-acetylmuramoyl-pentapeptide- transferase n=1 Tax=Paenibacillus TaxID=44249 RepID=UPI00016691D0|nr:MULTISPECIES: phospho-N-acetylmuramoyl-pentapeptide-transferase [Paenibacillus]ACT02522.1 phospho-N-acetylmuramoyl-pentapeptide-transferase [Paenibacillus sp. JDR-2]MCK9859830.1 phospho-N-acetylmuramoyl-pentapeptide-transferase [Paenibacillus sp. ATY16]NIK68453.1 phospho-N-acetylmuramoyl-pentapeptide-transferase [Paenibacillus sp. BK720]TCM99260.1 phospho-N-acetylmuramoyl-pentapeptide-transferase [Paenibacillus sp. BK033]
MDTMVILFSLGASFLIAVLLGPLFIPLLRRMKFGQQIRTDGPQSHLKKSGTPTMGGIIIMLALLIAFLKFSDKTPDFWVLFTASLGFGLVGFLDDYIKIVFKRSLGLTARQKLFGQLLFSIIVCAELYNMNHSTMITVPGTSWGFDLGWFYYPFVVIILFGSSNAVNFTDGLDGLLSGTSAIAFGAFTILALQVSEHESAIFSAAMVGAVLGFLIFNAHPAKVFMGDTGSLGIGGGIAAVAILTKMELMLVIVGGVFVLEMLSVILQVGSFKLRGKRIFKMSPIHHHFELSGWSEWRVVTTFWSVGLLLAVIGLLLAL